MLEVGKRLKEKKIILLFNLLDNRTKSIGYFRVNKPWNVTKYYKELNILGKYVNGKWIKNY